MDRFRASASFWESDRLPEPEPSDLDRDLAPSDPSLDEPHDTDFQIRVETRIARLPHPAFFIFLSPRPDCNGLTVPVWVHRDTLSPIAAALHAPGDIEVEAFSRWAASPMPYEPSTATLPDRWTDRIIREGFDLWLLRDANTKYGCRECNKRFSEMHEEFHNHGSEHNVHIRCPNGHTVYYKTVPGPYRF